MTQFLGWEWIFLINLPLTALSFLICVTCLELKERGDRVESDVLGAALCMLTLFTMTLGLVQGRSWGWTSITIL